MAAIHRRGGKHSVKDKDLTHTKYDHYTREELLAATKDAGCYVKDDKKSVMARRLADHDGKLQCIARQAAHEQRYRDEKRVQELRDANMARHARRRERQKRNDERGFKREHGDDVSSNSEDTDDADEQDRNQAQRFTVAGGEVLSDETWEDTCTETTVQSENPPVEADCKLQLFEWSYMTMPPLSPLPLQLEQYPRELTYAPLRLTTTQTSERLTLPGLKYPAGVSPDYVPILDPLTRSAARHGCMIGILAHATVERASAWANRTMVQGWNARMYFFLPPHNDGKKRQLDLAYLKQDLENAKLLRPTPGTTDPKGDHKQRFAQRQVNKRKKVVDVLNSCQWKPLAMCYLPSYLDWQQRTQCAFQDHSEKSIDNLFYVRFPGCDVPHYYFWAEEEDWSDPTITDTAWNPASTKGEETNSPVAHADTLSVQQTLEVRTPVASSSISHSSLGISNTTTTLESIECDIRTYGLVNTLQKYQSCAIANGKGQEWSVFMQQLPVLYPSGQLPIAPPIEPTQGTPVAEKIADLLCDRIFIPYNGNESWTRNDEALSESVTSRINNESSTSDFGSLEGLEDIPDSIQPDEVGYTDEHSADALHRRDSMEDLIPLFQQNQSIYTWLGRISSAYSPHTAPLSPSSSVTDLDLDPSSPLPRIHTNFIQTTPDCPFCSISWHTMPDYEQAAHMLSHSRLNIQKDTTALSQINVGGLIAKRRYSRLSINTLKSYNVRSKWLRLDPATCLADRWASLGRPESPHTRQAYLIGEAHEPERRQVEEYGFAEGWVRGVCNSVDSSRFGDDERETNVRWSVGGQ